MNETENAAFDAILRDDIDNGQSGNTPHGENQIDSNVSVENFGIGSTTTGSFDERREINDENGTF